MSDNRSVGGVLVLLLFALFAVCMLMVLLTGADTYRALVARDQSAYEVRTVRQYLTQQVRQADTLGAVKVASFAGAAGEDTLFLSREIDGVWYETRIYACGGYLRELFCARGGEFEPEDGEKVMAAESISFSYDAKRRQLCAEVMTADGTSERLTLFLRSGEGAAA